MVRWNLACVILALLGTTPVVAQVPAYQRHAGQNRNLQRVVAQNSNVTRAHGAKQATGTGAWILPRLWRPNHSGHLQAAAPQNSNVTGAHGAKQATATGASGLSPSQATTPSAGIILVPAAQQVPAVEQPPVPAPEYEVGIEYGPSTPLEICDGCDWDWLNCCTGYRCRVFFDWLYLQPRGADLGFAFPTDAAFGSPLGATEQLDYDFESGFRSGVSRVIDVCDSWLTYTATHFTSQTNASEVPGAGFILGTLLLVSPDPLTADAFTSTFAFGRGEIDFHTYDLDCSKLLYRGYNWELGGLLGLRIGTLDEQLRVIYDDDLVTSNADLRGAGLRLGIGGRKNWTCWHMYGRSTLSVMATDIDVDYEQINASDGQVVDFAQDIDRIIPVLDLEIGISWDLKKRISWSVGYMYSIWFNVVTTPELINDLQAGDFSGDTQDDLTFDGFFTRVEFRW